MAGTKTQAMEFAINNRLASAVVGETVEMPWGERVTLLDGGETSHIIPLTRSQAEKVRAIVARGVKRKKLVGDI